MHCLVFLVRNLLGKVSALLYMVTFFFCDQTEVDEFVINASCGQKDDFKVILFAGMQILNCKYVFKAILACMFSCKF